MSLLKRFSFLVALVLIVGACTGTGQTTTSVTPTTQTVPSTSESTTSSSSTSSTLAARGIENLSPELQDQIAELVNVTERLRGLEFMEPPLVVVVSDDELEQRTRELIAEDTEGVEVDQALMVLLGLLPSGTDLQVLYENLYGEQTAGYYDTESGELVVPARDGQFTILQQTTLVHELTHALTDQHYGFGSRLMALSDNERFDEASAFRALIEGDASLAELRYIVELSNSDRLRLIQEALEIDLSVFTSSPQFLQDLLSFPYQSGQAFVEDLFDRGGYEAIGAAYGDPPSTTEQVVTPRKYNDEGALAIEIPQLALTGYTIEEESVWGELLLQVMFDQIVGSSADPAVEGWGGDRYQVLFDGSEVAFVLHYKGDTELDAIQLEEALIDYALAGMQVGDELESDGAGIRLSADDYVFVGRSADQVLFIGASDPQAGQDLRAAFAGY